MKNKNIHSPEKMQEQLIELGLDVISADNSTIKFWYNGNIIQYFPKKQWASGKGINDGRGWENLINQLKYIILSKQKPYYGVYNYILKNYPEVFKGTLEHPETRPHREVVNELMVEYIREILELPFEKEASDKGLLANAETIQKHWHGFKSFLEPEYDF